MTFSHECFLSDQVSFYLLFDFFPRVFLKNSLEINNLQSKFLASDNMLNFVYLPK